MTEDRERASYRFGALERRGLAGGLRASQVVVLGCASLLAVALFRRWSSGGGLALAALILAAACGISWLPIQGRGADEWLGVIARWIALTVHGRRYRSPAPESGTTLDLTTRARTTRRVLPPALGDLTIEGTRLADGGDIGVFVDRRRGTLTAVLSVRVRVVRPPRGVRPGAPPDALGTRRRLARANGQRHPPPADPRAHHPARRARTAPLAGRHCRRVVCRR